MFSVFEKSPFVRDLKFKRCVRKYKNRKCPQNPTLTVVEHIGPWMPKIQCLKWLAEERKWDNLRIWHSPYLPNCSSWTLLLSKLRRSSGLTGTEPDRKERRQGTGNHEHGWKKVQIVNWLLGISLERDFERGFIAFALSSLPQRLG